MGRAALLSTARRLTVLAWVSCAACSLAAASDLFDVRMVKLGGRPGEAATSAHLEHAVALGFNSLWVYSHQAGRWSAAAAPDGPFLDPAFLDLLSWCRTRNVRVFVSVNPVADTRGRYVFSRNTDFKRLRRFVKQLRKAGVEDIVVSFDDQPATLTELNDVLTFGRTAAPAHLDVVRRLDRAVPDGGTLWLCAAAYADVHLADGTAPYAAAFLDGIRTLPERIGVVWTGPDVLSESITRADLMRTRRRLGGRRLLLYDNYPVNGDHPRLGIALVLGPLRNRGAELAQHAEIYLACPMSQLGASRLPLATIAAWLADPHGYDPDLSWADAMQQVTGTGRPVPDALRVQAQEWGGFIGHRNYRPAWEESVLTVADRLNDPAYVASFVWTLRRYPDRMRELADLEDTRFRDDLLTAMAKRLAVARALTPIREYRARRIAGRRDAVDVVAVLENMRRNIDNPEVGRAFDRFMVEAGVPWGRTNE